MERNLMDKVRVYLEVGRRRTFAAALEWPGWCRMGRNEETAIQTLFEYGPRYGLVLRRSRLGFLAPKNISALVVVERLQGNATTDFGAPDIAPSGDSQLLVDTELHKLQSILKACWRAWGAAFDMAAGKTLRTGPRGGGRNLDGILQHVLGAEQGYLSQLGGKISQSELSLPSPESIHQVILNTLVDSARGQIAKYGPRGGKRWSPRYFVRREAWHVLDHVWEIEDRVKGTR